MLVDSDATRRSLILRIGDTCDQEAWRQYVVIYQPKIEKWALRYGVHADEIDEVVQEVLMRVAKGARAFILDSAKGRYRAWLKTIAHNVAADVLNNKSRQPKTNGQTGELDPMSMVADEAVGESLLEYLMEGEREALFRQAEQQTRGESSELEWESYHQSVYKACESLEIAESLGIKVGHYYKCKSVFIRRLEENFKKIDQ